MKADKITDLKEGEVYCKMCKQIMLKRNQYRHDISEKHEKAVFNYVKTLRKEL